MNMILLCINTVTTESDIVSFDGDLTTGHDNINVSVVVKKVAYGSGMCQSSASSAINLKLSSL